MAAKRGFTLGLAVWSVAVAALACASIAIDPTDEGLASLVIVGHALLFTTVVADPSAPVRQKARAFVPGVLIVFAILEGLSGFFGSAAGYTHRALWFDLALSFAAVAA